jgi:steroid delta-isomerase-like uncharacterized protein
MSTDRTLRDTKSLVSEYIERVWNRADALALNELCAPSYAYRLGGQPPRDKAAMTEFLQAVHEAFPDWRVQVLSLIAQGNKVVAHWNGQVTHRGVFHGVPPTGKRITVSGINVYEIVDGKIAREWEEMDALGMLQQLRVL